ncbi:type 2 lanthipeptide synthetase LanM family protein [Arthrobacter sp. ok362]|uniref:type 2 lanthipeptide synthetase LanM family protein n=1 Tax=Arthrobacter sp. ok362 TaxID=1761745 RepID=UPI000882E4F4|nr:type 2 lanthipeptide synthetase LanM family protein [Arthrobacter sp. ok362]SDL41119.1 type 2 lantibiotic biosynthesis protein LanM [Arthrobacter sp. ok362]
MPLAVIIEQIPSHWEQMDEHDRAVKRLEAWKEQEPFRGRADLFAYRLSCAGVSEGTLRRWNLDEIAGKGNGGSAPWVGQLRQIYATQSNASSKVIEEPRTTLRRQLLSPILPIIENVQASVNAHIEHSRRMRRGFEVLSSALSSSEGSLDQRLARIIARTIALELGAARIQGQLYGGTSQARFLYFINDLTKPQSIGRLFDEYPVLAHQCLRAAQQWRDATILLLTRLSSDYEMLCLKYGDLGDLQDFRPEVGDRHNDGQSVCILQFTNNISMVYKPRAIAIEKHFYEFIHWLNEAGVNPQYRVLELVDRETYGWSEFVHHSPCTDTDQLARFFRRQGGYLAILHSLLGSDLHLQNVIASGEHPMLVDLEGLFHVPYAFANGHDHVTAIGKILRESVLIQGMLPSCIMDDRFPEDDLSGITGSAAQHTSRTAPELVGIGTDHMHVIREIASLDQSINRPVFDGSEVDAAAYRSEITDGFGGIYDVMLRNKKELSDPRGPLSGFRSDEVRRILRPTEAYASLLDESFHPNLLRESLDRERLFDRLWCLGADDSLFRSVVPLESADLWNGDIPHFTARVNSRALNWREQQVQPEFFTESGFERALSKARRMTCRDRTLQQWLIRAAIPPNVRNSSGRGSSIGLQGAGRYDVTRNNLGDIALETVESIAHYLGELSLEGDNGLTWICVKANSDDRNVISELALDLYDGLPGLALFFGYTSLLLDCPWIDQLADETAEAVLRAVHREADLPPSIGGFSGLGGLIYCLSCLAVLQRDERFAVAAKRLADSVSDKIGDDEEFDLIHGSAGCVLGLLALNNVAPAESLIQTATVCADHLLESAMRDTAGISWITSSGPGFALTGAAHGSAGVALSLLRLYGISRLQRHRSAALATISWERNQVRSMAQAALTSELRATPGSAVANANRAAWCHGPVGIGVTRLQVPHQTAFDEFQEEVDRAMQAAACGDESTDVSLCHGTAGVADLVIEAGEKIGWSRGQLKKVIAGLLVPPGYDVGEYSDDRNVLCPGLMTGLAGVGYELLRVAAPRTVPSVLVLAPPSIK